MARLNDFDRFLKRTELTTLLGHTLRGNRWTTAMAALHRIEAYVQGAAKQQARINRAAVEIQRPAAKDAIGPFARYPRGKTFGNSINAMAVEIHYYLICWNAVRQQLQLLQEMVQSRGLRSTLRANRVLFDEYTRMRDNLEHYDERLLLRGRRGPRGSTKRMKNPSDFGHLSRNTFSFGGERIDISPKSLLRLRNVVESAVTVLKLETWQTFASSQPVMADRLVRNYARDLQTQRMLRRCAATQEP